MPSIKKLVRFEDGARNRGLGCLGSICPVDKAEECEAVEVTLVSGAVDTVRPAPVTTSI